MLLRVCLGVQQSRLVYYIILHMVAFQAVKKCAYDEFELLRVLLCGKHGGGDLLVQEHTARDLMGRELGYALENSGRPVFIHGMCGRAPLCQGLFRMTSVRRRHCTQALADICRDRGGSAVADAADGAPAEAGIFIFLHFIQVRSVSVHDQLIGVIVVVAVFRSVVDQHLTDPLALFSREVCRQSVHEFIAGNLLIFKYQLFNCGEAVCHIGDADLQAGDEIVYGAALFDGLAASQAVLCQAGAENIGHFALAGQVDGILHDDACAGKLSDRAVPCLHQFIKRFHIPEVPVIPDESPAAGHIDAVVHDHQEDPGEIQVAHAGAAIAPLSGHGSFYTADRGIAVGILFFDALLNEGRNDDLVVVESRHAGSEL